MKEKKLRVKNAKNAEPQTNLAKEKYGSHNIRKRKL